MPPPPKVRLGDLLIQRGLLTENQLLHALDEQKKSGQRLGRIFVDLGYVSEDDIAFSLAQQLRITYVNLRQFAPRPELTRLLPEVQARRFRAMVLDELPDGRLQVGLADPTDLQAYDDISRVVRREIDIAVVAEGMLMSLMDRVYHKGEEITGLARELTAELSDGGDLSQMFGTASADDVPVAKLLNTVFEEAIRFRASDLHFEPQETTLRIRFRIDGALHIQTETDVKINSALVLRMKLISGLDISEKRLPQDGRFNMKLSNGSVDVRISTLPTQYGESVVMRLLNQGSMALELDKIGMPPRVLDRLRHALSRPSGLVLVTGPTGSGKTTTLYSALNDLNSPDAKVITVEDPVEYRLPGLNQVQINDKIGLTFARVLRTVLRQDPDVVLVGEMRDQETAEIGMRAAMTGHLVLSTLHTNDAMTTPIRLLDMGVPKFMVALSVVMVLAQRLVRVICRTCKEQYELPKVEREWLRYELGDHVDQYTFYHGKGCPECNQTGYKGRTGVYEFLEMSDELVDAANSDDHTLFLSAAKKQMAGETLRRDAVRLAISGKTTVSEAMKISNQYEG